METYDAQMRSPPQRQNGAEGDGDSRDRDRDAYRDNRRNQDRRRAPRTRSRSPVLIDRYQPDRNRDDYYAGQGRGGRRASPPPSSTIDRYVPGEDRGRIPVNQLRDPLHEPMQVGFSYFSEWWRAEQDVKSAKERQKTGKRQEVNRETKEEQRSRIQQAYDEYKLAWNAKMAQSFVSIHKTDSWFRERYDIETRDRLRAQFAEFRRSLFEYWETDLSSGVFDDFTAEGIHKSESNGNGGIVEREEGEAAAAAEVLAVSDLVPARGGDLKDPVASLPALLIKTITPAVSRDRIEQFCKEHLGQGKGGMRWLSLSDPNPGKKFHRLGWIMLDPTIDDDEATKPKATDDAKEASAMDEDSPVVPVSGQEKALAAINDKIIHDSEKGDFTVHVGIHRPTDTPRKKALWDLFSAPERIDKDLGFAIRLVHKLDNRLELAGALELVEQRVQDLAAKGLLQPHIPPRPISAKADPDQDMEEGEEEDEVVEEEIDDEDLLVKKKKLDLLVEYLRRVHNFCFYCVFETDSVHELQRKCVGGHLRRPRASLTSAAMEIARASAAGDEFPQQTESGDGADGEASPNDQVKNVRSQGRYQLQKAFNWVKTFEEKLLLVLEPENADLRRLGGRPLDEGIEEEMNKYVKQEDVNKYRCKAPDCSKLFKGLDFWRKHIEKRHTEWYEGIKQELELVNRYVLDPSRLAQGRNDAASNGHFPVSNPMMSGTPRNFSLNNALSANGMLSGSFHPVVGHYGMAAYGTGDGGTGPMRNGGRGAHSRAQAPYDRGSRRGPLGRLTPPRSMPPGRPRPSFMEGGIGTFGSAQAVEGRTMKSYNDLDAASGPSGGAALDY